MKKDFYEIVFEKIGTNCPFSINDLEDGDFSYGNIRQQLSRMAKKGKIVRFSQGIYFVPTSSLLGISTIDPDTIIQKKYLEGAKGTQGFRIGLSYENAIGLTEQVPMTLEIVTNLEKTKKRTVKVGFHPIILRRPVSKINSENFRYLQLLEYLRFRDITRFSETRRKYLQDFFSNEHLSRKMLLKYAEKYPSTVSKRLLASGIIDGLR